MTFFCESQGLHLETLEVARYLIGTQVSSLVCSSPRIVLMNVAFDLPLQHVGGLVNIRGSYLCSDTRYQFPGIPGGRCLRHTYRVSPSDIRRVADPPTNFLNHYALIVPSWQPRW